MYSMLFHLLMLSTACCRISKAATHAQQQVYLQGTQQLSVTVRAKKINFSPNALNEKEIFPASSATVHEHALTSVNNAENEHNNRLSQPNKTKSITTTSEAGNRANYRKSRIIVKETLNAAPLKLPYGFRPAAAPRYPLQYPFAEKSISQKHAQSLTEMKTQMIRSSEDWTPIAYVMEPFSAQSREAQPETSSTVRSLRRSYTNEPRRETVNYGAQRSVDQSFLANVYDKHLFQSGNAKPDNVITHKRNSAALGGMDQQYKLNERLKQRKGIAANEKMHSKYQATDTDWQKNSANKPEEHINLHIEENKHKKAVKDIEMANMNNQSAVTMKISLRRAMKNTSIKSDNSSSSSSAGSIAGHVKPIMMSTHPIPFKSNETTWPLNVIDFATSSVEAALADSSTKTASTELSSSSSSSATSLTSLSTSTASTTELSTSASTSASVSSSSSSYSSKTVTSSTTAKSSASSSISKTSSTANPTTNSNNLTTAEPKTCVPMIVRENSFTNPAEIIELERIVCFPLPPDAELNFDELLKEPVEVIKQAVKDRNLQEDFWNSRMNSKSSSFDKNLVLLYLTVAFWFL